VEEEGKNARNCVAVFITSRKKSAIETDKQVERILIALWNVGLGRRDCCGKREGVKPGI
jgi:hypothetical protein